MSNLFLLLWSDYCMLVIIISSATIYDVCEEAGHCRCKNYSFKRYILNKCIIIDFLVRSLQSCT